MGGRRKIALAVAAIALTAGILVRVHLAAARAISIQGAVVRQGGDAEEQSPIANVEISAADGLAPSGAKSDFSGFFKLTLLPGTRIGQSIRLSFRHANYQPLDLNETVGDRLYVVRMTPVRSETDAKPEVPQTEVANVLVTYSVESPTLVNVGSAVKTFKVPNTGNVPCNNQAPCSPNGKWKAAAGSVGLDAGEGNEFRNARLSCIAGPCPFTKVDEDYFSQGGRHIGVTVRNWSDTTTFLLQAEVFHRGISNTTQSSHPVIFGRALSFTLPPEANGPSLEAELNGAAIVFPLGPSGSLSWAGCEVQTNQDQSKAFQCTLKPGYQFQ